MFLITASLAMLEK